ncbi:hypothetical protein [Cetobacterium sp.]|uniref:hypothetical protein n=1 Tax=Cetobacterium sp. TaxID=2071632 RepID=UPI003EE5D9F5
MLNNNEVVNDQEMLDELKETFHLIVNWLQFAEAKNGVTLALIGGIIYTFNSFESELNSYIFLFLYILLALSFLSSILSFYPNITTTFFLNIITNFFFFLAEFPKKNDGPIDENLKEIKSFYGDIAKNYKTEDYELYLKNIAKDYYNEERTIFQTLEKEYAKEIIILSKIAVSKYTFFKFTIKSIVTFTFILFISLGWNKLFKDEYYVVIGKNTIVRDIPDINGLELFKLKKSISVKKIDIEKNWIKIEINKKIGWVHKSLLEKK